MRKGLGELFFNHLLKKMNERKTPIRLRDTSIFFSGLYEDALRLDVVDQYELFDAVLKYNVYGVETEVKSPMGRVIWNYYRPMCDRANTRYDSKCSEERGGLMHYAHLLWNYEAFGLTPPPHVVAAHAEALEWAKKNNKNGFPF